MRQTAAKLCSICPITARNKTDILFTRTYKIKPKARNILSKVITGKTVFTFIAQKGTII
jgi:hypothetical protein